MASKPALHLDALHLGAFSGRDDFAQIIREAIDQASASGWKEMLWSDKDFADWPLAERRVEAALQAWSQTGRKLTLIAKSYSLVLSNQHRFVNWRKQWSHIIEARAVGSISEDDFPCVLWSPEWALHRTQLTWSKGTCTAEPAQRLALRELLNELYGLSAPAFPAVTLGL
jgi:hypothetical protein